MPRLNVKNALPTFFRGVTRHAGERLADFLSAKINNANTGAAYLAVRRRIPGMGRRQATDAPGDDGRPSGSDQSKEMRDRSFEMLQEGSKEGMARFPGLISAL